VEKLGAWSGAEGVEALPESALKLIGCHGSRLRRGTVAARVGRACPHTFTNAGAMT
jgi:hypothetical protein